MSVSVPLVCVCLCLRSCYIYSAQCAGGSPAQFSRSALVRKATIHLLPLISGKMLCSRVGNITCYFRLSAFDPLSRELKLAVKCKLGLYPPHSLASPEYSQFISIEESEIQDMYVVTLRCPYDNTRTAASLHSLFSRQTKGLLGSVFGLSFGLFPINTAQ